MFAPVVRPPLGGAATRHRLLQLTRLTAGYSLATLAGPLFAVVLTPLYMHALTPADYAILDTTLTIGILTLTAATLGLNAAPAVFFYDGGERHGRAVVATAAVVGVAWATLVGLGLAAAAYPLASYALGGAERAVLIRLSALNLPFAVLYSVIQAALRLRLAVRRSNALALCFIALSPALNLLLVLGFGMGVLGVQIAGVITSVAVTALGLALTARDCWARPDPALAWPLVRAGLPFIPNALAFWSLAYLDRLLLPLFHVALDNRGLYAVANRMASLLAIATAPFQSAWGPLSLAIKDDPHAPRTYGKVLTYFVAGALGLALAIGLFAREILALLTLVIGNREYVLAAPYVGVLAYYPVANGAMVALGVGAFLAKRTAALGWTTALGAAVNLLLNLLLIPRFGVWGAAWATALGYGAAVLALYWAAQRLMPLPFEPGRALWALLAQGALLGAGGLVATGAPLADAALKLLLLAVYPAALVALRVLEPREARMLLGALRRPRSALREVRTVDGGR